MVVPCITGNLSTIFIMEQINFACFISGGRINICHNTIRSKLHAFNRIRHKIFCNHVKLVKFSRFTDQNLFQNIRNVYPFCNLIFYAFPIGCCI